MIIYMWSGPRNISTALMRSFENRQDTEVWDEPLYAYYLDKTKKNHPMSKEIIAKYNTNIDKLIKQISSQSSSKKIIYQKHMTHHIIKNTPINWIKNGVNCFLIRDPKDVLLSYIKNNKLKSTHDLGYPMQKKIFGKIKKINNNPVVINADDLLNNPRTILMLLCKALKIRFSEKMMKWPKGKRDSDGIWAKIWYDNVQKSTGFIKAKKNNERIPKKYQKIYLESLKIYNELNSFNIINAK